MLSKISCKKNASVFIALVLIMSIVWPSSIMAAGTGDDPRAIPDIPSPEQMTAKQQKIAIIKQLETLRKQAAINGGVSPFSNIATLSVPSFEQETNYWCGPATTKQVLHYLNKSSESQSYYANELGTTTDGTVFSIIDDVLNDHQSKTTYIYQTFSSNEYDTWETIMLASANLFIAPAVLDLQISPSYMPLYTTHIAGHILNTSGYDILDPNNKKIRLTDPFDQGGRGVTLGNVWHPMEGVWQANQAHFRKAVIY